MLSPASRAETLTWRVVKPNVPIEGRAPVAEPLPLRFLGLPHRPGRLAPGISSPQATVFQVVGPLLVEVPLASELQGPLAGLGFVIRP